MRDQAGTLRPPPDCLAAGGSLSECGVPRSVALDPVSPLVRHRSMPGFHPVDLTGGSCGPDRCTAAVGSVVVYADSSHLHAADVMTLVPELDRQLSTVTGWW